MSSIGSRLRWWIALGCVGLAGCGVPTMTPTGPVQPPRPENCNFQILTTLPADVYAEIAVIDIQAGGYYYTDTGAFKEQIRSYVCKAGGDAALAYANGNGQYIKATVLKLQPKAAPASKSKDTAGADETAGGCKFDTQCKGDRICTEGKCVAPPAATTK